MDVLLFLSPRHSLFRSDAKLWAKPRFKPKGSGGGEVDMENRQREELREPAQFFFFCEGT